MFYSTGSTLLALVGATASGHVLWDGRVNGYADASFLADWSFSNKVGPYQYYIHGSGDIADYVVLSPDYKNPADMVSEQGIQISIDGTSSWNGQDMMRTELIPQTTAPINQSLVFYHFSIRHTEANPPSLIEEHQICFFESHFTELKYGLNFAQEASASDDLLRWMVDGVSHWNVTLEAGVWHNVAYGIDFDAQTVSFYYSTGADDLSLTAGPIAATTYSDAADWHLGVLRLPQSSGAASGAREDWQFSGVYVEGGHLTMTVSGPASNVTTNATAKAI